MSHKLAIRVTNELHDWLSDTSRRRRIPMERLIRELLETAMIQAGTQLFLLHAGVIEGGRRDVSRRKGLSRT